mgnify:CR=1 FL=1
MALKIGFAYSLSVILTPCFVNCFSNLVQNYAQYYTFASSYTFVYQYTFCKFCDKIGLYAKTFF